MSSLATLHQILKKQEKEYIKEFLHFLRFPSISSDPQYKKDILACVEWLRDKLNHMDFKTELWETAGHPVLFASWMEAGPDKPTLLIYNHYDVQPVDPLDEWITPPFEPAIRGEEVYARGACDDKGQCFYVLLALKILLEKEGKLPLNVKLCIEGEEEVGSAGLSQLLQSHQKALQADYLAIVDLGTPNSDTPTVTLGTRGIVTFTILAEEAVTDLHSGSHGGMAYNPLHALVQILSTLRRENGEIAIPGFYDEVIPLSSKDKEPLSLKFDVETYQKQFGMVPSGGEKQFSPLERAWTRPTLEINGIVGGYGGAGFKTVIPAKAIAKISCRLVPNQDPQVIGKKVADYIKKLTPAGVKVDVTVHPGMGKAVRTSANSKIVQTFAKAYTELFGKPCQFIFEGGSIPIVPELAKASGAEVVLMGLGLPDDKIHAPNEHFGLKRIERGALLMARAIQILAE